MEPKITFPPVDSFQSVDFFFSFEYTHTNFYADAFNKFYNTTLN